MKEPLSLKERSGAIPLPRTQGIITLTISGFSFFAGYAYGEIVLSLIAFMLFVCLAYSFTAIFFLSRIHAGSARLLSARLVPEKITAGAEVSLILAGVKKRRLFWQLPAVLIRYELRLSTKDGKLIEHRFARDFFITRQSAFCVPLRGLYAGGRDRLSIFDAFGFFYAAHLIDCGDANRLWVSPAPLRSAPLLPRLSGGGTHRGNRMPILTDNLIEQRPYLPGDDPRRINWKLYGHLGDIFVREEDREPPPHTRLALLICAEVDESLPFGLSKNTGYAAARRGAAETDLLCETALDIAAECAAKGVAVTIGSCGAASIEGGAGETENALALPFAAPTGTLGALPSSDGEQHILLLALPRAYQVQAEQEGALDKFLHAKRAAGNITLLFIYHDEKLRASAVASALNYGRQGGVYAQALRR